MTASYEEEIAIQDNELRKECEKLYKGEKADIGNFVVYHSIKTGERIEMCLSWHQALILCLDKIKKGKSIKDYGNKY